MSSNIQQREMSARDHGPSQRVARWVGLCALAESIGMGASALAARASMAWFGDPPAGSDRWLALGIVVLGGLVEGTALGVLQARGLSLAGVEVNRGRWFTITLLVAGLGWACASAPPVLGGSNGGSPPPMLLVLCGASAIGVGMGALLGFAQSWAFGPSVSRPRRWTGVNAVAWAPAMAIIFTGAMAPTADSSIAEVLVIGVATGAAAGAVLGVVTARLTPELRGG